MPQTAETVLYTNGITDNSENSNDVYVGELPGGLSISGQNVTLTLPPSPSSLFTNSRRRKRRTSPHPS